MFVRSVTAHAFGPLRDETLELAERMTVIVGDNESAKSTWHAAIFASLCGQRRNKGRPSPAEQHFAELHKPWDAEDWLVSAEIMLDDGRHVEMRQDLAGKVGCHAIDLQVGHDISAQVINDGSPDGARWLGLDRSSFVATACVGQAGTLKVLNDANGLQHHLQRAAATAGADTTAAAALERLEAFQHDHVGVDRSNAVRPLRTAIERLAQARKRLHDARLSHEEYLDRVEQLDSLRAAASRAAGHLRAHEAVLARQSARKLAERSARAEELYAIYGDVPPSSPVDDDTVSRQVATALAAWRSRPPDPPAQERPSTVVQAELDALPGPPAGDTEVHSSVQEALDGFARAQAQLQLHNASRPAPAGPVPPIDADDDELLDLAWTLETPPHVVPEPLVREEEAARRAAGGAQRQSSAASMMIASGAAAVVGGAALLLTAGAAVCAALLAIGTVLLVGGALQRSTPHNAAAVQALAKAQVALSSAQQQADIIEKRRKDAIARLESLGVGPDPAALRRVPVIRAHAAAHADNLQTWEHARDELQRAVMTAVGTIAGALAARGEPSAGLVEGTAEDLAEGRALFVVDEYRQACSRRALQAQRAARRSELVMELTAARATEQRALQDLTARNGTAQLVLSAARACGAGAVTPEEGAIALEEWSARRTADLDRLVHAQEEWAELQALLSGRTLADLEHAARGADEEASRLELDLAPGLLASVAASLATADLARLQFEARAAAQRADTAAGELNQFLGDLDNVAEAEEALEAAEAEVARVRELDETLDLTRRFLDAAQEQVHRDIAPVLAQAVKRWLPQLTGGRYTDVTVDPTTLQVAVCGPARRWRKAELLSHGTAEQIYLLLRIALADHLTKGHDTCPLILDDVTVHADNDRARGVLELLLDLSQQRQVVLFTQEDKVASWARATLSPPHHAVLELAPVATV
jgi:hypothetical protein